MDNQPPSIKQEHRNKKESVNQLKSQAAEFALEQVAPLPIDMQRLVLQYTDIPRFSKAMKKLFN